MQSISHEIRQAPAFSPPCLAACGRAPEERLAYEDLLTNGRLASSRGSVEPAEGMCGFENRWGVELADQEDLGASFTLGRAAT